MDFFDALVCTTLKDELCTVCIWDANNGTLITKYRGGGFCSRHGLASNGGYIFTCEKGKPLIHVWPFNKQHTENKRLIVPGKITSVAVSPENVHIAVSVAEKVHLYQTCSGQLLGHAARHFQPITVLKFSNDGSLLCCGGEDGLITVWDVQVFSIKEKTPEPKFTFSEHSLPITDFCVSYGKNSKLYSVSEDMSCKVFDLITGQLLLSMVFYTKLSCITLSPVETDMFLGNSEGAIYKFSLTLAPRTVEYHLQQEEGRPAFLKHDKTVTSLACTIDCAHLISGSLDETIKIWSISSKSCLKTILQKGPVTNILYIPFFPKSVFDPNFQPVALLHDFVNPANTEENEEPSIEVFHPQDLVSFSSNESSYSVSTLKRKEDDDVLKDINRELYEFAVKKLLEKRPTQIVNTTSTHMKKKKKYFKNKFSVTKI